MNRIENGEVQRKVAGASELEYGGIEWFRRITDFNRDRVDCFHGHSCAASGAWKLHDVAVIQVLAGFIVPTELIEVAGGEEILLLAAVIVGFTGLPVGITSPAIHRNPAFAVHPVPAVGHR